jgi:Trk K+ transport system NAD-binding subunit
MADGFEGIYGVASAMNILQAASIEDARLVVISLTDHEATLAVMRLVRTLNSRVTITARAKQAEYVPSLIQTGAALVIVPELAGADTLLNDTLDLLGMPR